MAEKLTRTANQSLKLKETKELFSKPQGLDREMGQRGEGCVISVGLKEAGMNLRWQFVEFDA